MDRQKNSHSAPATRLGHDEIKKQHSEVGEIEYLKSITDAFSAIALVLNQERQVVFANDALFTQMGITDITRVLGMRPGEIIQCVHSGKSEMGCGASDSCRYCNALEAVLESQETKKRTEKEARITVNNNGSEMSLDLMVSATPFKKDGQYFYIVTMTDISDLKRREALERIFFHDIINTASGLKGYTGILLKENDPEKIRDSISLISDVSTMLLEEILSQKDLMAAERGELQTDFNPYFTGRIIRSAAAIMEKHPTAKNIKIQIDEHDRDTLINTDSRLLTRVLVNLIKNALEASDDGGTVSAGYDVKDSTVSIYVTNTTYMDNAVQNQLFQRSFSTKGKDRGLGTYSIKLITEKYLNGSVSFTSSPEEGTVFYIELPRENGMTS